MIAITSHNDLSLRPSSFSFFPSYSLPCHGAKTNKDNVLIPGLMTVAANHEALGWLRTFNFFFLSQKDFSFPLARAVKAEQYMMQRVGGSAD